MLTVGGPTRHLCTGLWASNEGLRRLQRESRGPAEELPDATFNARECIHTQIEEYMPV
jgi:hypothetical protein